MTNREVIEKILAYHPDLPNYHGCDDWKCGNPDEECTGIVTALVPTVNVIKKASELGANLIVVHEPTFYTSADQAGWFEDFPCAVYEEKRELIDRNHITIWRDHDHMHFHRPDGIFTGVLKYLGWENCSQVDTDTGAFAHFLVDFPEMTVEELCRYLVKKIGMNGVRYIGDPQARVKSLAFVGHLFPGSFRKTHRDGTPCEYSVQIIQSLEERVDVILPGEIIDWTVASYVRDAVQQGRNKAMINLGHMNWEELGMKYAKDWISELVENQVPVTYVPSEDMYRFVVAE
ncbi:MAG: Nif3-like dinuclear metal center hexameric protein [Firmicutes bacterium]|nr:Nif3-like dinuclear metal center hexameric protein [Bacillota bacterium]